MLRGICISSKPGRGAAPGAPGFGRRMEMSWRIRMSTRDTYFFWMDFWGFLGGFMDSLSIKKRTSSKHLGFDLHEIWTSLASWLNHISTASWFQTSISPPFLSVSFPAQQPIDTYPQAGAHKWIPTIDVQPRDSGLGPADISRTWPWPKISKGIKGWRWVKQTLETHSEEFQFSGLIQHLAGWSPNVTWPGVIVCGRHENRANRDNHGDIEMCTTMLFLFGGAIPCDEWIVVGT
jgi:hypothetical protein